MKKITVFVIIVLIAMLTIVSPAKADSFLEVVKQPMGDEFNPVLITKLAVNINDDLSFQFIRVGSFDKILNISNGTIGFAINGFVPFEGGNFRPCARIDIIEGIISSYRFEFDGRYGDSIWFGNLKYDVNKNRLNFSDNIYHELIDLPGDWYIGPEFQIDWVEGSALQCAGGPGIGGPLFGGEIHLTVNSIYTMLWWFNKFG